MQNSGMARPIIETSEPGLIRCSQINGCGELKPRNQIVRVSPEPLCMACYQRARRLLQDPAEIRRANLWAKYRITPDEYDSLRAAQDFRCWICGIAEIEIDLNRVGGRPRGDGKPLAKVPLAVDHDHTTGAIRGLLCPSCNAGLGAFGDDPNRLNAAISYLRAHQTPECVSSSNLAPPSS